MDDFSREWPSLLGFLIAFIGIGVLFISLWWGFGLMALGLAIVTARWIYEERTGK